MSIHMALKWIDESHGSIRTDYGEDGIQVTVAASVGGKVYSYESCFEESRNTTATAIVSCVESILKMIEKDAT